MHLVDYHVAAQLEMVFYLVEFFPHVRCLIILPIENDLQQLLFAYLSKQ